ncbi:MULTISPECIES: TetR/AcrR family transcriptional regulator [unclassified Rhodococcus (in: high G+C Gram-positive bacteria)]|uniref:TetR/AcrR family transcriptional regulator n=1 Tax=unclassified Rhodococcus (in: high G+C Gram-positive bacteria) TaxID=192944 RepID=UPI000BC4424D|nr:MULTISPECIES: TetR/AcrR family transcriptional regulator [unclassified Rhodococcus (in: high G+C Gram-positive bacteria)]PTR44303.1 TetR family transcriptional regulator [Rhodococcus sp. OK611]SNX89744.1 transcriptional regulator, TetR family [Rhodococcus sp. OK270]
MARGSTTHKLGPHQDPAVDAAILSATRRLLVEVGYSDITINSIAAAAGVGRPAVYRRWPAKVHIVHEAVFPPLTAEWVSDDQVENEVRRLVFGAVALFGDPVTREAVPGLMCDMRSDPALKKVLAERLLAGAREGLAQTLADGARAGQVRPGIDAGTLLDTLAGAAIVALSIREVDDLERLATSLTDLLLHGILA